MITRRIRLTFLGLIALGGVWVGTVLYVERTRTIEGTWVDLFEGSSFFEGQNSVEACSPKFSKAPWFSYSSAAGMPARETLHKNQESGQLVSEYGPYPVAAYTVKFIGRRNVSELLGLAPLLGIGYGHLGMKGSAFEADKVISIQPIPNVRCDVR